MFNRDIYQRDPSTLKLVNEGMARVNVKKTIQVLSFLRYKLETFVCDSQYEKGLENILHVYLKIIKQAEQPAVWISGFYGSEKSHLVKILGTLWVFSAPWYTLGPTYGGNLGNRINDHHLILTEKCGAREETK